MRGRDLSGFVLQHIRKRTLQNAWQSTPEARRVIAQFLSASTRFHSDQLYFLLADEVVKNSNGIRSSANTCDDRCWKFAFSFHYLGARLAANHRMKIPHHGRIRMRPQYTAQQIMSRADVGDPI